MKRNRFFVSNDSWERTLFDPVVATQALQIIEKLDQWVFADAMHHDPAQALHQTEDLLADLKLCLPEVASLQKRLRRISELAESGRDGGGGLLLEIVALKISVQRFMEE